MALLNIRSILNKASSVNDLICDDKYDIMFLTETWLDSAAGVTLALSCPMGYSFMSTQREVKKGGGLAIIFLDTFICKPLSLGSYTSFEYQATIVQCKYPVLMIIIYRPPKLSKALFLTELADLLSFCSTEYDRTLLTGDYNLHVDNALDAMEFLPCSSISVVFNLFRIKDPQIDNY